MFKKYRRSLFAAVFFLCLRYDSRTEQRFCAEENNLGIIMDGKSEEYILYYIVRFGVENE